MEKETIKKIFDFLEDNEGKRSFLWKLVNDEPLKDEELSIKGDLDLNYTGIRTLPKGLKVGGFLFLKDCSKLTSLPEGLEVEGWLDLENTPITSIPKGLKVHGDLYITDTALEAYTDKELREMVKPGFIKGEILR
jgi:hypothetical protein